MTPELFISAARSYLGVRFFHQGRSRAHGIDCIGLIMLSAKDCGLLELEFDYSAYGREPANGVLANEISKRTVKVESRSPGDILLMSFFRQPIHVGIYSERNTLIHSYQVAGKCIEHTLDAKWSKRVIGIYRIPQWHS